MKIRTGFVSNSSSSSFIISINGVDKNSYNTNSIIFDIFNLMPIMNITDYIEGYTDIDDNLQNNKIYNKINQYFIDNPNSILFVVDYASDLDLLSNENVTEIAEI